MFTTQRSLPIRVDTGPQRDSRMHPPCHLDYQNQGGSRDQSQFLEISLYQPRNLLPLNTGLHKQRQTNQYTIRVTRITGNQIAVRQEGRACQHGMVHCVLQEPLIRGKCELQKYRSSQNRSLLMRGKSQNNRNIHKYIRHKGGKWSHNRYSPSQVAHSRPRFGGLYWHVQPIPTRSLLQTGLMHPKNAYIVPKIIYIVHRKHQLQMQHLIKIAKPLRLPVTPSRRKNPRLLNSNHHYYSETEVVEVYNNHRHSLVSPSEHSLRQQRRQFPECTLDRKYLKELHNL